MEKEELSELLKLARRYFISDEGQSVANLIRKIQLAEGHVDCFATGRTHCENMTCRWRKECLPDTADENGTGADPEIASLDKKFDKKPETTS
jgi:hypothetical protein